MVNKAILIGRLGRDPEMRFLPDGTAIANLSIATQRTWHDETGRKRKETEWHTIIVWERLAHACAEFLAKGHLVYVEGRLQTRSWDADNVKHYRTEVVAEQVKFLERKTEETQPAEMPTEDLPF